MPQNPKHSLLALAAALALAPGLAGAEQGAEEGTAGFSRSGLYIGVGATYASDIFEDEINDAIQGVFPVPVSVDIDDSWGAHAVVGYRLLPFLAAEIEYEWVDEFDIGLDVGPLGIDVFTLEAQTLTANLKLILPTWRVQPYLLVGAGGVRWEIDDKLGLGVSDNDISFAGRFGGGLDLYLTPHLVLNAGASVVLTTQDISDPSLSGDIDFLHYVAAGAGLQYRF